VGGGVHRPPVLRRDCGRVVLALGLPVQVGEGLLAAGLGHQHEVPALGRSASMAARSQLHP
jgi:hypothetical protein